MLRPIIKLTVTGIKFTGIKLTVTGFLLVNVLACSPSATIKEPPDIQSPTQIRPAPLPTSGKRQVITPMPSATMPGRNKPKAPDASNYVARGVASWYSVNAHGVKTASGEVYDLYGMTAAHASLPLQARVKVENLSTGKSVIVTINDRLYDSSVLIKLSSDVARRLGLLNSASEVEVHGLPGDR